MNSFHINEFNSLRDEVLEFERQEYDLLKYSLLSNAALISWVISQHKNDGLIYIFAAWIPFVVSWFFYSYFMKLEESISIMGQYLKKIEDKYADEDMGWEEFSWSKSYGQWSAARFALRLQKYGVLSFSIYYTASKVFELPDIFDMIKTA